VLVENAMATPGLMEAASIRSFRLVSVLCHPVRAEGRIAGIVHLEHSKPGFFTASHRDDLASLLDAAAPVFEALLAGQKALAERNRLAEDAGRARVELEESRGVLAKDWSFGRFVGRAPTVRALEETVRKAAATDWPVLLTGETGTGKGIVARILHYAGPRAAKPFVTVFCPSLERGLVESELFGHRRGAFTGADADRIGKVQAAEGGTLFLDEVGDLHLDLQAKILRLLQEKTYERLGDPLERRADVRVVAATNRDLEAEIAAGRFRRDLYERLNFLPVAVPPLRDRRADVPVLLRYLLDQSGSGRWIDVAADAERWLAEVDYLWPGNVRHLEQLAARLVMEAPDRPVGRDTVQRLLGALSAAPTEPSPALDAGLPELMARSEREWLARALREYASLTRREVAERLRISEAALYKKLRQHGLGSD
jgi:transcriptional regulator with GAF, ATPase, and Fis domain